MKAVNSSAGLSASTPELISIRNHSQSAIFIQVGPRAF
jgi:hypothetical protein